MLELTLTLAPAEGALVRVLGLIERRGFRLGAIRSEPSPRGLDVFLQLPADRPGDVLLRQVQRLHDVRAASLDIARSAYPAARPNVPVPARRGIEHAIESGAEAVPV
ncbi:ACT domain-containing protein [Chiayiivirga flava]|uniref:Acetolactate synthase regulatory subunit n=1 Tax=Chiayiivirga flava TaxID=659595 RepID=A0A7W8D9K0_9GAMM|nr:ACT domain-containing protein [Chiayiivirga flava]MBB5209280.1 acetolactate synthase regulatory subunit [Chiayiivirga flava]